MAADDYHNNDFIFKAISAFRIIVGVAVTLAVLFAMVWLIDYSSIRPSSTPNQAALLPDHREDDRPQQSRTFFETLLNKKAKKNEDVIGDVKNTPDSPPRPGVTRPSPAVQKPESPPVVRSSESPGAATKPKTVQSTHSPAIQSPAVGGVFAVQLGSFHQTERARMFLEKLVGRGYQPYIINSAMPDGTRTYRVRIGRFATREDAMNLAAKIEKAEKISVFVTSQ